MRNHWKVHLPDKWKQKSINHQEINENIIIHASVLSRQKSLAVSVVIDGHRFKYLFYSEIYVHVQGKVVTRVRVFTSFITSNTRKIQPKQI